MKRKIFSILFALVLLCSFSMVTAVPVGAVAIDWYVDCDVAQEGDGTSWEDAFDTIQEGLNAASPNETITVADGIYTESITVTTNDLTLRSVNGRDSTVIENDGDVVSPEAAQCGFLIRGSATNFTLGGGEEQGFTFSGGTSPRLIQLNNGPSVVEISHNCVNTTGDASTGILIGAAGATALTVSNNTFIADEDTEYQDWPLIASNLSGSVLDVTVTGNEFTGSGTPDKYGAAIALENVEGESTFSGNTITAFDRGIIISGTTSSLDVSGNDISNCGKGVLFRPDTHAEMENNTFAGNTYNIYHAAEILTGGSSFYGNIQDAINDASPDDTIQVYAGTYTEQINIVKSLTITGSGQDTTHIVSPDPTTMDIYDLFGSKSEVRYAGHRGANIPVVRIAASDVTFEGFHVDLDNQVFWDVLGTGSDPTYSKGVGILVDHVQPPTEDPDEFTGIIIQNNKIDGLLWDDVGDGIKVLASATVDINHNTIYSYGESAISAQGVDKPIRAAFYPTVTANSNTIYGGTNARLDEPAPQKFFFGIGYWSGAEGSADDNTIYNAPNNNGYALNSWTPNPVSFTNNFIFTDGGTVGGYGAQLYESSNLIFSGNDIQDQGLAGAIYLNPTVTITKNNITNCTDGFIGDGLTAGSVTLHYNNFSGIAEGHYAIDMAGLGGSIWGSATACTITADATKNWWGKASGPDGAQVFVAGEPETYTGVLPGTGDKVSAKVKCKPWLTREFQKVVEDDIAYFGVSFPALKGWNIVSAPLALDAHVTAGGFAANTWGGLLNLGKKAEGDDYALKLHYTMVASVRVYTPIFYYDSDPGSDDFGWRQVTELTNKVNPVDAYYIRMMESDSIPVLFSPDLSVPSKKLYQGWNLVGCAYMDVMFEEAGEQPLVKTALATIVTVSSPVGDVKGYSQVVSPPLNQEPWIYIPTPDGVGIYIPGGEPGEGKILMGKGYWVFMENPGTLAGLTFTPISLPKP